MDTLGNISINGSVYGTVENSTFTTIPTLQDRGNLLDSMFWGMHLYLTPIIIVVGLSGNALSLMVFILTPLRHLSSSVYLAALCIGDSAFLAQLFAVWLIYVRVFLYHRSGWCQMFIYTMYVSSFLNVWFVVCFTLERYIVCIYPLRKRYICNVHRAKITVISISVFALVFYSFGTWTTGVHHNECSPKQKYLSFLQIIGNIDTVITLVIPSVLIIIMNARIVAKLAQSSKLRTSIVMQQTGCSQQLIPLDAPKNGSSGTNTTLKGSMRRNPSKHTGSFIHRSQLKTTKMLVTVSTIFVILNTPNHVIRMYITLLSLFAKEHVFPEWLFYWQQASNFIYYINFAINLFLYSLCGQNFRLALKSMFFGTRCESKDYIAYRTKTRSELVSSTSQSDCEHHRSYINKYLNTIK